VEEGGDVKGREGRREIRRKRERYQGIKRN
jgi:hypothetical protein